MKVALSLKTNKLSEKQTKEKVWQSVVGGGGE